jgi:hypothetical protein
MPDDRSKLRLVTEEYQASGKPPKPAPVPLEGETLNPAPDKDYSREQPSTEGDENDPEIEDE